MSKPEGNHHCDMNGLQHSIEHAAHLLPAQGPITVFVHHNTLHAFEDLCFEDAVRKGKRVFGCETYLSEERYREFLERDRIRVEDISEVLLEDLAGRDDGLIGPLGTRFFLRLAMLQHPLRLAPSAELRWLVAESDALRRFRKETPSGVRRRVIEETHHWIMRDVLNDHNGNLSELQQRIRNSFTSLLATFKDSDIESWDEGNWESFCLQILWRLCYHGVQGIPSYAEPSPEPVRHRDLLLQVTGFDSDQLVNELLIRFAAPFLDQGVAGWQLPFRELGFFRSFCELYGAPGSCPQRWMSRLHREIKSLTERNLSPLESIQESLDEFGVLPDEREAFLSATLLALRGWAGMIWQIETRGDRVARSAPPGSLIEFLAVRLLLDRLAVQSVSSDRLGYHGPLSALRDELRAGRQVPGCGFSDEQRAFLIFQLAQVLGWMPSDLYRLCAKEWALLVKEIESFSSEERRRIYHLAYERRYRIQTLDAISVHARRIPTRNPKPSFQVVCCIDDREESFRRHLEELDPQCETLSAAGFFAVPMYYRGAADAHYVPLCPIVMRPQHWVDEDVVYLFQESHRRRQQARKVLGTATQQVHFGSRTFAGGALLTALVGPLASIPLIARVLFPRLTSQVRRLASELVQPPPVTQLRLERVAENPGPAEDQIGFTAPEMAAIVERLLRDLGLTSGFSRVIIVIGHGSSSLNNPHESAYNCGACAGARGGPNARAFAHMANDRHVRDLVAQKGLVIPSEVVFIGAFHNTCDDRMTYFDLDRLPPTHKSDFDHAKKTIDRARERNAHERSRRFESAPLGLTPEGALRHVEGRAEDLAQTRPEYNHATNAICFVGRRSRTRGLFMDRRCFLNSYDPTQDDQQYSILTRILQAAVPVCAGISLEYYFSCVDPVGWGCSTKLPHNLTSLLGVMDGAASDLRTGLSSQMIEIHEPMRLLFVIETTTQAMTQIMDRNPAIAKLCRNEWVQLSVLDPDSSTIHVFRRGRFERYRPTAAKLPEVENSIDWYRGWRDHLGFAIARSGLAPANGAAKDS